MTTRTFEESRQVRRAVLYLPVAFFCSYLILTSLLFAFGPWTYPVRSGWVYLYLLGSHLALVAGYFIGARAAPAADRLGWSPPRLVTLSLVATALFLVPTSLHNTGSLLPDFLTGLRDPGGAYARSVDLTRHESVLTLVSYARVVAGPLLFILWPLTIYYWRRLGVAVRTLSVACILFTLATYIAMGTNRSIADTLLIFPWVVIAARASGNLRLSNRRFAVLGIGWLIAMVLWLSFFASTQTSRAGSSSAYGILPAATPLAHSATPVPSQTDTAPRAVLATVDYGNWLVRFTPEGHVRVGVVGLASYVTQGYYALSLALEKPFIPMWGVGNSIFATRQVARLTGREEIAELPYPMRLRADGWDPYGQWSSIYPWIASDASFPGSIVIVFAIGWLFARAWRDALAGNSPFAVVMVALLVVMLFYFPANNQVLQFGEGFTAFWLALALWLFSRGRQPPGRAAAADPAVSVVAR